MKITECVLERLEEKEKIHKREMERLNNPVCICAQARMCMHADAVITRLACRWRCVSSGEA